jgi:type II secretory pathway component PulF
MPTYTYLALSPEGSRVRAVVDAGNEMALARALHAQGLTLLRAEEKATTTTPQSWLRVRHASHARLLEITRALASLLAAGMPLARALKTAEQITHPQLRDVVASVRTRVERGAALAAALEAFPQCFNALYIGVVRAGERSGDLASALTRLSQQLERDEALRARLLSASIYPLVLATAGGIAITVLLVVVLPRFAELLVDSGAQLPASTSLLLRLSVGFREGWISLAAAVGATVLSAAWWRSTDAGRRLAARALLALPWLGALHTAAMSGRFARLTGVLLGGGATLYAALDDVGTAMGDPLARDEVTRIRARVREGASLSGALTDGSLFPPLLTQLVLVGEEAGAVERFLNKAADLFDERADRTRQRLVALAEPAMIIVFGGIIGFVALSMLQAVYSVNASSFR